MQFEKINEYATRQVRGTTIFAFNMHGASPGSGWGMNGTENSYLNANSWHRPPCPVPAEADYVTVQGMWVGGAQEAGPFFFHIDIRDPNENPSMESALDWSDVGGQGSIYYYYFNWNVRAPMWFRAPLDNQQRMLLRWKLETGDSTGRNVYMNPVGLNLWCAGYGVAVGGAMTS
jgi:hypothetical protein